MTASRKQKKRLKKVKKPRTTSIVIDWGEKTRVDGVGSTHDGQFEFLRSGEIIHPQTATVSVSFARDKGNKILSRIPLLNDGIVANPHEALRKYDRILAVDTNTKAVGNKIVSVACVVLCKLRPKVFMVEGQRAVLCEFSPIHLLEFWNVQGKAENIAIRMVVQGIATSPQYMPWWNIGIITDTDLDNLPDYNERRRPLVEDFFLPRNVELIYASAERAKEYLPNVLISICDKEASKLIAFIEANPNNKTNLREEKSKPYTHFRFWSQPD